MQKQYYEELPVLLTPKDVGNVLGIKKDAAYNLFRTKSFPSERVGGKYIIPKFRFLNWLGIEKE